MSAIDDVAKRAADEILDVQLTCPHLLDQPAIIARHYREGVRELVLAARDIDFMAAAITAIRSSDGLLCGCVSCHGTGQSLGTVKHDAECPWQRFHDVLEGFSDIDIPRSGE